METIINIILLEGVNIETKNNNEISLCHTQFTLPSLFPIKYLNPLLQIIINNRNELDMKIPLYLGYSKCTNEQSVYKDTNIIIDNNLTITSIIDNKDVIYKYKNSKNRFPICWLNDNIIKLIR